MTGVDFHLHQKRIRLPGAESEAGRPRQNDGLGVRREYQIAVAAELPRPFDSCVTAAQKAELRTREIDTPKRGQRFPLGVAVFRAPLGAMP